MVREMTQDLGRERDLVRHEREKDNVGWRAWTSVLCEWGTRLSDFVPVAEGRRRRQEVAAGRELAAMTNRIQTLLTNVTGRVDVISNQSLWVENLIYHIAYDVRVAGKRSRDAIAYVNLRGDNG